MRRRPGSVDSALRDRQAPAPRQDGKCRDASANLRCAPRIASRSREIRSCRADPASDRPLAPPAMRKRPPRTHHRHVGASACAPAGKSKNSNSTTLSRAGLSDLPSVPAPPLGLLNSVPRDLLEAASAAFFTRVRSGDTFLQAALERLISMIVAPRAMHRSCTNPCSALG